MKYILLIIAPFLCYSQTVWNGPLMTFTKQNYDDPSSENSLDRITDLVWLTRGNNGGQLYNAKIESNSSKSDSPQDTRWAFGTTSNLGSLTFSTFRGTSKPKLAVGQNMVVHLISDDIYIDIKITSWASGNSSGGGFSYERSTNPNLSVEYKDAIDVFVYPNPTTGLVRTNHDIIEQIRVYDLTGKQLMKSEGSSVDLSAFKNGVYLLQLYRTDSKNWVTKNIIKHQ